MKLLWNEKVYGWWSVTGLLGAKADWFFGFSRKPPSPAQPIPPITDPRTAGVPASEDDFKTAVLRCRYPVHKDIHRSGHGWDTSRLNEVIADHTAASVTMLRETQGER